MSLSKIFHAFRHAGPALLALFLLPSGALAQSGGRARALVAPFAAGHGVDEDFGRDVASEVRDRLTNHATLAALDEDDVERELQRLELEPGDLSPLQWRQLAGQMDADLLIAGTIKRDDRGYDFEVHFIDVRGGDTTAIQFTTQDDRQGDVREATGRIMDALQTQIEYQRALLICAEYVSSEQWDDAARNCDRAMALNPGSLSGRYLRARIAMGQERWADAKEDLDAVVEANPAHVEALNSLAYTEATLGHTDRARELYQTYLSFNPDAADVRMQVAYDLARTGDYDGAILLLQDGIARDSTNAEMWKFLGDVLVNKGTASDSVGGDGPRTTAMSAEREEALRLAISAYERVMEIRGGGTEPGILRNLIAVHLQLDEVAEAERFVKRAEAEFPDDASLRSLEADILARQKRFTDAVRAMDAALAIDPDLPRGLFKRGFLKLQAGNEEGALADLDAAMGAGTDPNMIATQLLSRAYNDRYLAGRYNQAADLLEAALRFAQAPAMKHQIEFFLAFSYYQSGTSIDTANQAEACQPADRALGRFRQVLPHLDRAGDYQADRQAEIRSAVDAQVYRQNAILKKSACR